MSKSTNIFLYTAPVQAGKTTALMNWAKGNKDVGGFLAPDIGGLRRLYMLADRQYYDFQLSDEVAAAASPDEMVTVGKFNFSLPAFELARKNLLNDLGKGMDWIIIDEIGKLELKGEGLEPAAGEVIDHFQQYKTKSRLLLVVRDQLVEQLIRYYHLLEYRIIRLGQDLPE